MTISANNSSGRKNFENRIIVVTTIVNPILTKMALTLRLKLPGTSPGAFKKAPKATPGAYSKYPKKYNNARGKEIPIPILIPRSKRALLKNNSSCLSFSFKSVCDFILKVEYLRVTSLPYFS
jgi:hypothetical protein